jgi:syntaxin 1B/2/3
VALVKPDATPEEVAAVVQSDQGAGGQVFAQAVRPTCPRVDGSLIWVLQLTSSTRYGESRAAYREVQERHEDIRKIERTLAELAQLFNEVRIRVPNCPLRTFGLTVCADGRPCRSTG